MNDALYEQLVTRKSRPMDLVIRILCIAALVVVLCGGMLFIGSLAVLVTILLGVLIYYFVFPKLDVEYEYTLLNHDLEIDAIYSKSKRKKLMTLDIQQAEIIAPKNSHTTKLEDGRSDVRFQVGYMEIPSVRNKTAYRLSVQDLSHEKQWRDLADYAESCCKKHGHVPELPRLRYPRSCGQ